MKKKVKKLVLARETVRRLTENELMAAEGATGIFTCVLATICYQEDSTTPDCV